MRASATEVKNHFGRYLNLAQRGGNVIIERSGKELAALIDHMEYTHLKQLDDLLLIEKIKQAEKGGYLSILESKALFKKMLNRLADELEAGN